ncbi:ankyrin repeat-containing protein-like [Iris pallida]|uniref:Ankyrin repeat-containing protein-like n=1 Tax=Iris pallida TaxID=29817 RepID=A0AAX6DZE9_IRIPA|nr:ankyrin repeat-containing protein-like [Iris pallida]KAJ6797603.1 ankyrin repeat-containing protein-like [Iris pallida]
MANATTIPPRATHMNFIAVLIECSRMSWSSEPVKMSRQVTAIELTIAIASEMRNALKAASLARIATPCSELLSSLLYPPGSVKAAAKVTVAMRTPTIAKLLAMALHRLISSSRLR